MRQSHPSGLSWNNLKVISLRSPFSEIFGNAVVTLRHNRNRRAISGNSLPTVNPCLYLTNILYSLRNFIIERKFLNVKNVEKTSVTIYFLVITKELILKKNFLNVRNVQKLLIHRILLNREFKIVASAMNVRNVGGLFFIVHNLNNT